MVISEVYTSYGNPRAPGKLADLVLLDANPLADIEATRRIQAVVVNRRLLDRRALDTLLRDAVPPLSTSPQE